MKRHPCLSRLLPLALAAALLAYPAAAFRDTSGHWAEQTLNAWQAQGLLDGYADGTCQPDGPMTRAGFAKLMNRAMGFTAEAPISFTDVGEEDWFHAEAARAMAAGYAQGSGGMFLPRQNITRAQAAAMLARAAGLTANETAADAFTDAASLPAWAKGSIGAAAAAGLMSGYADGTFRADGLITRAQAVVALDRLMKHMRDKDKTPAGTTGGTTTPSTSGGGSSGGGSSGGSSGSSGGGSSSAVWTVTGAEAVPDVTVDCGTSEAEAMGKFPGTVTLNAVKRGQTGTVSARVSWALDKAYDASPLADTVYTATGTVTLPDGYTYSGALTVTAKLTVKADPDKTVTKIWEVTGLELPHGAQPGDVQLPARVPAGTETGGVLMAEVTWTLNGTWASPGVNTYTGTVALPGGYAWNGQTTALITAAVTVVEDGATPKPKYILGHQPLDTVEISYAGTEDLVLEAARAQLPAEVMLQCQDNSYIAVTVPADAWKFTYTPYYPNPYDMYPVSLTANAVLPAGYEDEYGKTTVYGKVQVAALDAEALQNAVNEAKALLDTLTDWAEEALKDPSKIYAARVGTTPDQVPKGVRFIYETQKTALKDVHDEGMAALPNLDIFDSQAACDQLTQRLRDAIAAFQAVTPEVGTNYTDDMLRAAVKKMLDGQADAAYAQSTQPLKPGRAYPLASEWTDPDSRIPVRISWEVNGSNSSDVSRYIKLDANGATVIEAPEEPMTVVFTAQAVRTDINISIDKIASYTATLGAPISLSGNKANAPLFASGPGSTGAIYINLNGVEAITSVDAGKIGIEGRLGDAGNPNNQQIDNPKITGGAKSAYGVRLDASLSSAKLSTAQNFPISGGSATPAHVTGRVTVTIPEGALTLDESKGWYFPDAALTQTVEIWLCNPQLSVNTHMSIDQDRTYRNISVTAKYVGNAPVQVAFTKTNQAPDSNYPGKGDGNVWVWVEIPFEQSASGSDGERIYSTYNVEGFGGAGDYYVWCRAWEGTTGNWLYTNSKFTVDGQDANEVSGQDTE